MMVYAVLYRGSSPHTRGALSGGLVSLSGIRIIPAYAGSTPTTSSRYPPSTDHPRIRGEHLRRFPTTPSPVGSSPHTRGAPPQLVDKPARQRIIPAYAGSTAGIAALASQAQDHPRIRGEHGIDILGRRVAKGSSPHTRGAREKRHIFYRHIGIIPAYAGSTVGLFLRVAVGEDHPRIRGEHSTAPTSATKPAGSSPHTRGAPRWAAPELRPRRIIPAYAGSTCWR